jgi:RNA polymerase sigma-70 factor (ECF subfamily)
LVQDLHTVSSDGPRGDAVDPSEENDTALVFRCCHGDHRAWRALYDRHFRSVFRFVSSLGVPAAEREDATQDVFIAVYRSLPSFRGDARFSTWVYRITARHVSRLARRRRAREMLGVLLLREPTRNSPQDLAEQHSDADFVDRLLSRINPKKRTALVLFEVEGLSVEDISQIVECPVNTVWSRIHHARAELAKLAKLAVRDDLRPASAGRAEGE